MTQDVQQAIKRTMITAAAVAAFTIGAAPVHAGPKMNDHPFFVPEGPGVPKSGGTFLVGESADGKIKAYEKIFMDMSGLQEVDPDDEAEGEVTSAERLIDGGMIVYGPDGTATYHAPDKQ